MVASVAMRLMRLVPAFAASCLIALSPAFTLAQNTAAQDEGEAAERERSAPPKNVSASGYATT